MERISWYDIFNNEGYILEKSTICFEKDLNDKPMNRSVFKTQETAVAVFAITQLEWLRDEYIKRYYTENPNWKPDWNKLDDKYCVIVYKEKIETVRYNCTGNFLAFPTKEIRDKFLEEQRELIEQAKPLL